MTGKFNICRSGKARSLDKDGSQWSKGKIHGLYCGRWNHHISLLWRSAFMTYSQPLQIWSPGKMTNLIAVMLMTAREVNLQHSLCSGPSSLTSCINGATKTNKQPKNILIWSMIVFMRQLGKGFRRLISQMSVAAFPSLSTLWRRAMTTMASVQFMGGIREAYERKYTRYAELKAECTGNGWIGELLVTLLRSVHRVCYNIISEVATWFGFSVERWNSGARKQKQQSQNHHGYGQSMSSRGVKTLETSLK